MNMAISNTAREASHEESNRLDSIGTTLFRPMGVDGVYARTPLYEDVVDRLSSLISRH
jgi:hypothetical protein